MPEYTAPLKQKNTRRKLGELMTSYFVFHVHGSVRISIHVLSQLIQGNYKVEKRKGDEGGKKKWENVSWCA